MSFCPASSIIASTINGVLQYFAGEPPSAIQEQQIKTKILNTVAAETTMEGPYLNYHIQLKFLECIRSVDTQNLCIIRFMHYQNCIIEISTVSDGVRDSLYFCVSLLAVL